MTVIVVGAGIAGLMAARELSGAGVETIVLEARERIGGRIHTLHDPRIAAPIELGAEFVHGDPPEILKLAKSAGLDIVQTAGNSWFLNSDGFLAPSGDEPPGSEDELWKIGESYVRSGKPDISLNEFLRLPETERVPAEEKEWTKRFVSGFHAAEPEKAGMYGLIETQMAEESINGISSHRLPQAYSQLVDFLEGESRAHSAKLFLDNIVNSVDWAGNPIRVSTRNAEGKEFQYEGSAVIITIPVGVLKSDPNGPGYVNFSPKIDEKRPILSTIEMGYARRVTLAFKEKWWSDALNKLDPSKSRLGFLFGQNVPVSVWWTNEPSDAPMMTGWVGGPKSIEMESLTDDQFIDIAVTSLSRIFRSGESLIESHLIGGFTYDWKADPFSNGAYTYMGVGGGDAPQLLAEPINRRLYFAGEATSMGHWGTVHGAIASGLRVAREILETI